MKKTHLLESYDAWPLYMYVCGYYCAIFLLYLENKHLKDKIFILCLQQGQPLHILDSSHVKCSFSYTCSTHDTSIQFFCPSVCPSIGSSVFASALAFKSKYSSIQVQIIVMPTIIIPGIHCLPSMDSTMQCHFMTTAYYTLHTGWVLWFHVGCPSVSPPTVCPIQVLFPLDNLRKYKRIFIRLGMCIGIVEIWFEIANG